jgi:hypothetical protein
MLHNNVVAVVVVVAGESLNAQNIILKRKHFLLAAILNCMHFQLTTGINWLAGHVNYGSFTFFYDRQKYS